MGTNTSEKSYAFNFFANSVTEIKKGTRSIAKEMMECIVESDYNRMDRLMEQNKALRYSIQGYVDDAEVMIEVKDKLVSAGYASALMDTMQSYVERIEAQNEIQKVSTKYRDKVLRILAKHGTLLHGDLASFLEVSPSGLNAIIKKMNETSVKLVSVEEVSKFKLYTITPIAYKYITAQDIKTESMLEMDRMRRLYVYAMAIKYSQTKIEQEWWNGYAEKVDFEEDKKSKFDLIINEKYCKKSETKAQILTYKNWLDKISM